jgi:hypothetical protein
MWKAAALLFITTTFSLTALAQPAHQETDRAVDAQPVSEVAYEADDVFDHDAVAMNKKGTQKPKKKEGESCTYTSECESRPGMRCARPRGAALKVKTRCMLKGY